MADALKPGDPGYGVAGATPVPDKPLPTTKGPEWDTFMDPKRWEGKRYKPRPPETGVDDPSPSSPSSPPDGATPNVPRIPKKVKDG